jgi:hypothetical protein
MTAPLLPPIGRSARNRTLGLAACLLLLALASRLFLALGLPNDESDDGRLYALIARNVMEHGSFSVEERPPYEPTYIRLPGYPLALAGVYRLFGMGADGAVRVIQAFVDLFGCLAVGLLALRWTPGEWGPRRRARAFLWGLALAAACPFAAIYVACILTETWATTLTVLFALAASWAIASEGRKALGLWGIAGLAAGAATLFRPDAGLLLAAGGALIGLLWGMPERYGGGAAKGSGSRPALLRATALVLGFAAMLAPWIARNAATFGVFQPLSPRNANMPGEFVPAGYGAWLRTWVTDFKYVDAFEWEVDTQPLDLAGLPAWAADSPEEKARVGELFSRYNRRLEEGRGRPGRYGPPRALDRDLDREFAALARERARRHPLRTYLGLPLARAAFLWFDPHAQYYPWSGELLPLRQPGREAGDEVWLALFLGLVWTYTILGIAGAWRLFRNPRTAGFTLLLVLLIVPRVAFLATMENPEPRYVVELFPLAAAAGAVAIAAIGRSTKTAAWG